MTVSAVLVHYHTPELAARAVASLHREAAAAAERVGGLEVVVVDNGSDPEGRRRLGELPCRVLDPGRNLGYAGGLNLGVGETEGEILLLANPDLELLPGSLSRLVATVREGRDREGRAIAGPRFVWDRSRRLLLPPGERRDRVSELLARLALGGESWAARGRRRWRRHARRHWQAVEAFPSLYLSGALLVATRAAWEGVGEWDPGYPLYFEETDWLLRAARRSVPILHEPRAVVVHHYNRSAAGEPRAADWFAESEARFVARWYGPLFRALRRRVTPASDRSDFPPPGEPASGGPLPRWEDASDGGGRSGPPRLRLAAPVPAVREGGEGTAGWWLELSPLARGYPAAAERLAPGTREWRLPEEAWHHADAGPWSVALVDPAGRERFRTRLNVPRPTTTTRKP